MSAAVAKPSPKPRDRYLLEWELREDLRLATEAYHRAASPEKTAARERFLTALHRFGLLVVYDQDPDNPPEDARAAGASL
jgi:hypothetical protein